MLSELSPIPLETVRRRIIQIEKLNWVKYSPKTGVVYSPSEENNNLIVEENSNITIVDFKDNILKLSHGKKNHVLVKIIN